MELLTDDTTLVLIGPLDGRSTAEVREALYARLDHDLVLDLTQCDWIDVAALTMLLAAGKAAQRSGHRLIVRVGPRVRRQLLRSRTRGLLQVEVPTQRQPA